ASLTVIEHVRLTYACPCCEKQRQATGQATSAPPAMPATAPNPTAPTLPALEPNDPAATTLVPAPAEATARATAEATKQAAVSTFPTAPRPPSPIARGLPAPGLLAHLIVSKFCDHLPLYRCERMLARFGVTLTRSTMCDWLAQSAVLLRPLWELLRARV